MRSRLRRVWAPESFWDDLLGGVVAGVVIALAFRFVFGDSWAVAFGAGAFALGAATWFSWQTRDQRRARARE